MNSRTLACFATAVLFAALATPTWLAAQDDSAKISKPTRYSVTTLGSLGGTSCCFTVSLNDKGWVDGTSNLAGDKNFHPFLWVNGQMTDLGTLGGPNASVGGMNDRGDVTVGGSDTGIPDPLGEDFCGFGTHQLCLSYIWHDGVRTLIPTLGGNNNDVNTINNHGQVLAVAETAFHDPTCIAPQVLGYEGFIWEPKKQQIQLLPPLPGDSISVAFDINENGQAVGTSGVCANLFSGASALHVALWQNGTPSDLGSLGGANSNLANAINNFGQVVGQSGLPGDVTFHAFLWQKGVMVDLGTLPGDFLSIAANINDAGQIAIGSCDASFNCRAAIWQGGVMTDLNTLIPASSNLFLLGAYWINARGQIAGPAFDQSTGTTVPFLATPCDEQNTDSEGCRDDPGTEITGQRPQIILPENLREQLRQRRGFKLFSTGVTADNAQPGSGNFLREDLGINFGGAASGNSCLPIGDHCSSNTQCCTHACSPYTHDCCNWMIRAACKYGWQCCSGGCYKGRCVGQ